MKDRSADAAAIRGEFRYIYGKDSVIKGIEDAFDIGMDLK